MKMTMPLIIYSSFLVLTSQLALADTMLAPINVEADADVSTSFSVVPEEAIDVVDTADLLKRMPGANVNKNGPLAGIPQYRGMFGDRVNIATDGVNVKAACSNAMDPAMSHLPANLTDEVNLYRGIAPVSSGIETIGSTVAIKAKSADFGTGDKSELSGNVALGASSVDSGTKASTFLSSANKNHKIYAGLVTENGDSFTFDGGTNFNTEYERNAYLLGYGFQTDDGKHQLDLKYNYNDTGKTGTPALPMDAIYAKGGVLSMDYKTQVNDDLSVSAMLATQDTDHLMNNYEFRNVIAPDKRYALTNVKGNSYKLQAEKMLAEGSLSFGINGDTAKHRANIYSPDNGAFKIKNYDAERNRNSLFIELNKPVKQNLDLQAGLRYTQVEMDAGNVSSSVAGVAPGMPTMHRVLRDRFNASDRNKTDNNLDLAINLSQKVSDSLTVKYGLAQKTRSPSYQERYLWLPLESTSGLADGHLYFGNINLKPEKSTQFELGADIAVGDNGHVSPHIFYHRVNDFIQGTPTTTSPAPANTLTFNNVDADFFGVDVDFGSKLTSNLFLDGTLSYVRGKRRDIDDNLYRVAPTNVRLGLQYKKAKWTLGGDLVAYAKQNKVSASNSEKATAGYSLVNLSAEYKAKKNITLSLGVDNLFDKQYSNHLGGYNRNNRNSDVGFNVADKQAFRLPGEGRNIFATVKYEW